MLTWQQRPGENVPSISLRAENWFDREKTTCGVWQLLRVARAIEKMIENPFYTVWPGKSIEIKGDIPRSSSTLIQRVITVHVVQTRLLVFASDLDNLTASKLRSFWKRPIPCRSKKTQVLLPSQVPLIVKNTGRVAHSAWASSTYLNKRKVNRSSPANNTTIIQLDRQSSVETHTLMVLQEIVNFQFNQSFDNFMFAWTSFFAIRK